MTTYHFDEASLKKLSASFASGLSVSFSEAAKAMVGFGEALARANKVSDDLKNPLKFIEEMLRKARRGEVVLTGLQIKNVQPDRWESRGVGGRDRLRMDNRFKIEMEMYAPDRGAQSQPESFPVAVDIDALAMDEIMPPAIDYVVLQSCNKPAYNYKLPAKPYSNLLERIMRVRSDKADQVYDTLRVPYDVHTALLVAGIISPENSRDESPAQFYGLDLIIEPRGSGTPVFDDTAPEAWGVTDYPMGRPTNPRPTINQRMRQPSLWLPIPSSPAPSQNNARTRRAESRANRPEQVKPKTPAGASAAREIIFDD